MSMCLYLARGSEDVLREFAEDPEMLTGLSIGETAKIFDRLSLFGPRMAALHIYPGFDAVDAAEEYGDDIEHYFPTLRDHLAAAAAAREATLAWLS